MNPLVREFLDLFVRWIHIFAGILWIGNSMLFNWLDRNLRPFDEQGDTSMGKIWLLHSGAFYEVEKKLLPPGMVYPQKVHWFMFQNLTTWLSGIGLLIIVYYMGGAAYMVDPNVAQLSTGVAVAIGVGTLIIGWLVYDLLWRSPLGRNTPLAFTISFVLLVALSYGLTRVLSGRAAYIHIGALLGTLMTGNVWLHIVPSQRQLVAATKAGQPQDPALSYGAKQRSIHNNYMTFPVLFIMISNHFPSTYSNMLNWLILAILMVGSALVRHFMNIRFTYGGWLRAASASAVLGAALVIGIVAWPGASLAGSAGGPVAFGEAQAVIERRCLQCHATSPSDSTFRSPPAGIVLDSPQKIQALAPRIKTMAVDTRAMPFGNKTGMTDEERALLGRWIEQGARIDN